MTDGAANPGKPSELRTRVKSAIVLLVVVVAATWWGGWPFRLLWLAAGAAVLVEWTTIAAAPRSPGLRIALWAVFALVAALVLFPGLAESAARAPDRLALVALAVGAGAIAVVERLAERRLWAAGGLVYAALPPVAFAALRQRPDGLVVILFLFAVVFATDIFAYFVGRALKGPKLAPRISPGKTWSGAVGGAICAVAASAALAAATKGLWAAAIAGPALVLSVVSQIGDLAESAFKRRFGVKDSGRLIPGHGGVMDRIDALVVAAVALYLISVVAGGLAGFSG